MKINDRDIKNILVVRNDRFGEFLLNIPAFRAVKETFIKARIILIVDPYVKELAESVSFINEIIEWKRQKHPLWKKLRLLQALKRRNIDMAIMLNPSQEFNWLSFLAGIPVRVGYDRKAGFLLTHKMKDTKHLAEKHEVDYNLELVGLAGARTQDKTLSLKLDEDLNGIEISSLTVALHPWTSDPIKQWPKENFRLLSERLIKELNLKVVIVGAKDDLAESQTLFQDFNRSLINLTGRTTLRELAALLKKCRLLVSGDSGPMHLAACVGTPVIALFRNDIPAKSAKRWGPWSKDAIVMEKESLKDITVDEVLHKIKEIL